jgi:sterol desaturase/sphingolipid hydroxylase (fatty acid hydroxylase superfamily)
MLIWELRWPARTFPARRGWRWVGIIFLLFLGVVSTVAPLLFNPDRLVGLHWLDTTGVGNVGGALLGYVVLSGVMYGVHRAEHTLPWLWRMTHQLHHSPQRVDISGAALFHPVEMLLQVGVQLFVTLVVLGLTPVAAALTGYIAAFYGLFQHWNIRTPAWLGYLIQRPEAHCEHHRLGVHSYNYGDLPIWDLLFGTFRNPREFSGACGFDGPADQRMGAMLAFRDVNEARYGAANRGAKPS